MVGVALEAGKETVLVDRPRPGVALLDVCPVRGPRAAGLLIVAYDFRSWSRSCLLEGVGGLADPRLLRGLVVVLSSAAEGGTTRRGEVAFSTVSIIIRRRGTLTDLLLNGRQGDRSADGLLHVKQNRIPSCSTSIRHHDIAC